MKKVYLGWEQKLVDAVAERLLAEGNAWNNVLILVPTQESANFLKAALTGRGEGVPPLIMTSEMLIADDEADTAFEEGMALWAWTRIICQDGDIGDLIKVIPEQRTSSWGMSLADICLKAKRTLQERRLGFRHVVNSHAIPATEKARWETLARLDAKVKALMDSWGVTDPGERQIQWSLMPSLPEGIERVVLAGVADPLPLVMEGLDVMEQELGLIACECWVHGPDSIRTDSWGRPSPEQWAGEGGDRPVIDIPDDSFGVCTDAAALAGQAVDFFKREGVSINQCAVGVTDDAFVSQVQSALEDHGWPAYRMAGYEVGRTGLMQLLRQVRECISQPSSWSCLDPLCRSSILAVALSLPNPYHLACVLDRMMEEHLPDTVEFMREVLMHPRGRNREIVADCETEGFDRIVKWLKKWSKGNVGNTAVRLAENLRQNGWKGKFQHSLLNELEVIGRRVSDMEKRFAEINAVEALDLLCREMSRLRLYTDRSASIIKMEHWLDLSYDPADYIVLAGMHEGSVPDNQFEDSLLPDILKKQLKLRCRADRYARDAFLFAGMLESRKQQGGVKILVSRHDPAGNPCLPSSLLFLCDDPSLPKRVENLFSPIEEPVHAVPFSNAGWEWEPSVQKQTWNVISPSDIKSFLTCPKRFWLQKAAGFRRLDFSVSAAKAGNAVHDCAEQLGPEGSLNGIAGEDELVKGLQAVLARYYEWHYGTHMSLPVLVQMDYAMKRLERMARVHLEALDQGWEVVAVEEKLEWSPWADIPVMLRMRLDRIERHRTSGMLRVVDFKTRKKAQTIKEAHMERLNGHSLAKMQELLPGLEVLTIDDGKKQSNWRWKDLQLPLYAIAARHCLLGKYNAEGVSAAYFNLPLTLEGTGYDEWAEMDDQLLSLANDWAREIARIVHAGELPMMPSAEELGWKTLYNNDPYTELSPGGVKGLFETERGGDRQ